MISAILLANFDYKDDVSRIAYGYQGWENWSRYLSNFLSGFLHESTYLSDISPLPQILACLLLALASSITMHLVTNEKNYSWVMYAATIPFALSPYFLECISYKYDAPYMALSVLASVVPLLWRNNRSYQFAIAVAAGELIVCTTYQASSGILPLLLIFLCGKSWVEGGSVKQELKTLLVTFVSYAVALGFYKQFLMLPNDSYVSNNVTVNRGLFVTITANYLEYFTLFMTDFKTSWKVLIALVVLCAFVIMVATSRKNRLASIAVCLVAFGVMVLSTLGVYPLLSDPLFEPRAMYGIGVYVGILCLYLASRPHALLAKILVVCLSWCFFVFAFTYGNALSIQSQWISFRFETTITNLISLDEFNNNEQKTIYVSGSIGKSPIITNQPQDYQMLNRLVPDTYFGESGLLFMYPMNRYYGLQNAEFKPSKNPSTEGMELISDNMYESIYYEGTTFVVVLK
jgi:hypothetical protein